MSRAQNYQFKIASQPLEFEQIHSLNYQTFVDEIPQHSPNETRMLIDKFHRENTYIICLQGGNKLIGMLCVRDKRPFSLDKKVKNLDSYIPRGRNVCEIRLLSVDKAHRKGFILKGLLGVLIKYCKDKKHDLAVISGTVRQLKLYRHMGFIPFGEVVGTDDALYQPMYLTMEDFHKHMRRILNPDSNADIGTERRVNSHGGSSKDSGVGNRKDEINLMPGPVHIHEEVTKAFLSTPISHRGDTYKTMFDNVRRNLCELVHSNFVQVFCGSGTLANDMVAAQLSIENQKGIILSSGEFGERLVDHGSRFGLNFIPVCIEWGKSFSQSDIETILDANEGVGWLWGVHCETSTGILNDIDVLAQVCEKRGIKLCLDCISSIGVIPFNLEKVYLATGVSGKGLCSYSGLSFVFYNHSATSSRKLPRYLDMGYYQELDGIPFTLSSNLVYALYIAIEKAAGKDGYEEIKENSCWIRNGLGKMGIKIINPIEQSSPAVITMEIPKHQNSTELGQKLEDLGCYISYKSRYLANRNWIQVYITRNTTNGDLTRFLYSLKEAMQEGLIEMEEVL